MQAGLKAFSHCHANQNIFKLEINSNFISQKCKWSISVMETSLHKKEKGGWVEELCPFLLGKSQAGQNFFCKRDDSCLHFHMEESSQSASLFLVQINLTTCLFSLDVKMINHQGDSVGTLVREAGFFWIWRILIQINGESSRIFLHHLFACLSTWFYQHFFVGNNISCYKNF